jgi:hypothetical protein
LRWLHGCTCRGARWIALLRFCAKRFRSAMRPRIAFNRSCISQKRREDARSASLRAGFLRTLKVRRRTDSSRGELVAKAGSVLCFACFFYFFENFAARFPEKDTRGRRLRHKTGLRRFWCWSSRESAWPISKLISAMGGTLGPAPKAMQLSQPSLLSYLQRFNHKRRIHYKVDVQPKWRSDAPSPRIKEPVRMPSRAAQ